ncbi:MAG TPA: hypothetical protein VF011_11670 [Terriglobales bacterium]
MKIKRNVTEKVLAANRANGKKAKGPINTERSSQNASIHRLLARKLRFENDEERALYDEVVEAVYTDRKPCGTIEYVQVFDIAFALWNLQKLYGWLLQEMSVADGSADAILKKLGENYDSEQVPLFGGGNSAAAARGWECRELLVRTGNRTSDEEEGFGTGEVSKKAGQVVVDAKMTRTVDLILRYTAATKRDYYRALGKLQELQRERYELEVLTGGEAEADDEK